MLFGLSLLYWGSYGLLVAFIALLLATPLLPAIRLLERCGAPRGLAAVAVHLTVVGAITGGLAALSPLAWQQGAELAETLPGQYRDWHESLRESESDLARKGASWFPEELQWEVAPPTMASGAALEEAWHWGTSISWDLFVIVACILGSIYWSVERPRLLEAATSILPSNRREGANRFFREVEQKLGAFVRGQALLCLLVGLMAWVAYWWIDLPYAALLAVIAGICEAVPVVGPIVGTLPAVVVGLTISPAVAIWVIVANVIIASIESYLLVPRIMNRAVGVHPILTLLSITTLFALLGPIGGVLAVPISAIVQLIFHRWVFSVTGPLKDDHPSSAGRRRVLEYRAGNMLHELYQRMCQPHTTAVPGQEEAVEHDMELMIGRLKDLLHAAEKKEPEQ